jgi:hypothetical protein
MRYVVIDTPGRLHLSQKGTSHLDFAHIIASRTPKRAPSRSSTLLQSAWLPLKAGTVLVRFGLFEFPSTHVGISLPNVVIAC